MRTAPRPGRRCASGCSPTKGSNGKRGAHPVRLGLGANLGHLGQLQPVARALERMGHTILRARPPALLMKRIPTSAHVPLDDALDAR